jgi:peptide subunit release factor 1 (eRF1)
MISAIERLLVAYQRMRSAITGVIPPSNTTIEAVAKRLKETGHQNANARAKTVKPIVQ